MAFIYESLYTSRQVVYRCYARLIYLEKKVRPPEGLYIGSAKLVFKLCVMFISKKMFIYPCFGLYKYRTRGRCTVLYCKLPSAKKISNVTCKALKPNLNLLIL